MHLLITVLRMAALLLAFCMLLGGGYYAANFVPRFFANTDDSLSLFFAGISLVGMFWGGTILWTMYRAFWLPEPGADASDQGRAAQGCSATGSMQKD